MLRWRKNLPLRKGGLVADSADGDRYWVNRHVEGGTVYWTLAVRWHWSEAVRTYCGGMRFARQKHAKEIAERLAS